jgi:hypothetical protein
MGKGALSGTSISLPKMGAAGKLSVSPLKNGAGRFGAGTVMMDVPMEMVGKDSIVASWNLRMRGEDGEVRKCLLNKDGVRELGKERTGRAECVRSLFVVSFFVN